MAVRRMWRRLGWVALAGLGATAWVVLGGRTDVPESASMRAQTVPAAVPPAAASQAGAAAASAITTAAATAPSAATPQSVGGDVGRDLVREIQDALAQGTPAGALTAAELIDRCLQADQKVAELFEAMGQHSFQDVLVRKMLGLFGLDERRLMDHMQREQRNCQGLDAQTRAMRPALLKQALDAGTEGAALRYLEWLVQTQGANADPAQLQTLRQAIRREADSGSMGAIYALGSDKLPLGLTPETRQAGLRAIDLIEQSWAKDDMRAGFIKPVLALRQLFGGPQADPSLTREQLQAAEQQAQRLFEAYQRREAARDRSVG